MANHRAVGRLAPRHPQAKLYAYSARPAAREHWGTRLLRQALTAQLRADGAAVWSRAAAYVIDGSEVLVAGPPDSGTSTVLLTSLQLLGADFVADDRVLLRRDTQRLIGYPWPTQVRLATGTLAAFPELRNGLVAPDPRPDLSQKITIEPAAIPQLLTRGRVTNHVHPLPMPWPSLTLGARTAPAPLRVDPDEVRRIMHTTRLFTTNPRRTAGCRYGVDLDDWATGLAELSFTGAHPPNTGALRDVVDLLATTVTSYRVAITKDPRALAAQISDLLRRI